MTPEEFNIKLQTGLISQDEFNDACDDLSKKFAAVLESNPYTHFEVVMASMLAMIKSMIKTCPQTITKNYMTASVAQAVSDIIDENGLDTDEVMSMLEDDDEEGDVDPDAPTQPMNLN